MREAATTASIVSGSARPKMSGPHEAPSRDSACPRRLRGTPLPTLRDSSSSPTAFIARTGELTPPGITLTRGRTAPSLSLAVVAQAKRSRSCSEPASFARTVGACRSLFTICEVRVSTVLRSRGESSARRGSARASSSERIVSARSRSARIAPAAPRERRHSAKRADSSATICSASRTSSSRPTSPSPRSSMSKSVQPSSSPIAASRSRGTATSTSTRGFMRG